MVLPAIVVLAAGLGACETHHYYHVRRASVVTVGDTARPRRPVRRAQVSHERPVTVRRVVYVRPIPALNDGCAPAVRVVGPDAWTERGALIKAKRAWSSQVRFDLGERFADMASARDVTASCAPASTNESTVGKIGKSVAGSLAVRDRCVIVASPCEKR